MSGYQGRAVLVVGGLGFIGSALTGRLADGGAAVTVLTRSRARHQAALPALEARGVRVVEGDLRDPAALAEVAAGQALVFNLAGHSGAVRSMEDPFTDLDENCRGTLTLLEALRAVNPAAKVVLAGTRLHYGRPASLPVAEDAPSEPLCLHAIHKAAAEQSLFLYGRLYGIRGAVARITNPYGPGQPAGRTAYGVINRLIHLALAGEALTIYGDGRQRRDYVHVADVAEALLRIGESDRADGRVYNVGSGEGTAMVAAARAIVEVAGSGRVEHVAWPALAEQIETGDFVADITRIRGELGWAPATALRQGLEQTVAFYRAHAA